MLKRAGDKLHPCLKIKKKNNSGAKRLKTSRSPETVYRFLTCPIAVDVT